MKSIYNITWIHIDETYSSVRHGHGKHISVEFHLTDVRRAFEEVFMLTYPYKWSGSKYDSDEVLYMLWSHEYRTIYER